jgi:hypothetical protein
MEKERIELSQRERDWLKVLHEVQQKHLTQVAAAQRLKRADRQARRMPIRMREHGDGGIVHRLRGRRSNRKLGAALEQKMLARVRQRYADFGPTLAAEHLAQEGLPVSRETLRKWMIQAALWIRFFANAAPLIAVRRSVHSQLAIARPSGTDSAAEAFGEWLPDQFQA